MHIQRTGEQDILIFVTKGLYFLAESRHYCRSMMVNSMKIALAQINTTVGDFGGNVERIVRFASLAKERGADLVVFPELAVCGYPPRDLVEKPSFIERSEGELERLASLLPDIPALVGYVR